MLMYLGDLYRIYCNFEVHIGSSHPMSIFWIFTSRQETLESQKQLAEELAHHKYSCLFFCLKEDKDHWRRAVQYGGGTMSLLTQRESIVC